VELEYVLTTPLAVDGREAQRLFGELVLRSDAMVFEAAENTPDRERKTSVMFGHPNAWDTAGDSQYSDPTSRPNAPQLAETGFSANY